MTAINTPLEADKPASWIRSLDQPQVRCHCRTRAGKRYWVLLGSYNGSSRKCKQHCPEESDPRPEKSEADGGSRTIGGGWADDIP
jgi:hypothetical protein